MDNNMVTKILLADDHKIIRDGLQSLIEKEPDMEVVGEATNGRSIIQLTYELTPNLIVMDISMPDLNGIDATRSIIEAFPDIKIIALSMHFNKQYVLEMFKAGASGYLVKDCAIEELVKAIRTVMADQTYLCPQIATVVVKNFVHQVPDSEPSVFSVLTSREREVLQLLAEGNPMKEIAYQLNISIKTISLHRQHIMNKLDIHNFADLIKFAIREGLTSLEN